ncbi:hypothetical protein KM043_000830 [Ampulex compressa]|nr:hypothetical protein KM043_000830 [Ampulex compressa]
MKIAGPRGSRTATYRVLSTLAALLSLSPLAIPPSRPTLGHYRRLPRDFRVRLLPGKCRAPLSVAPCATASRCSAWIHGGGSRRFLDHRPKRFCSLPAKAALLSTRTAPKGEEMPPVFPRSTPDDPGRVVENN